jgi:hypothetical protein
MVFSHPLETGFCQSSPEKEIPPEQKLRGDPFDPDIRTESSGCPIDYVTLPGCDPCHCLCLEGPLKVADQVIERPGDAFGRREDPGAILQPSKAGPEPPPLLIAGKAVGLSTEKAQGVESLGLPFSVQDRSLGAPNQDQRGASPDRAATIPSVYLGQAVSWHFSVDGSVDCSRIAGAP